MNESAETRRLAAVMFTDMVGYTALTQRNETLAMSLLEDQNKILLPIFRKFGGTPVKTIGDAHLAEFESALEAVRCAVEIQRRINEYDASAAADKSFKLRIGIHVGDVVHKDNDVFGDAVNIASRLEPLAEQGGVCISQQVYDQVSNKVDFKLERLPLHQLKNVSMRIDVYKVIDVAPARIDLDQAIPRERVAVLPLSNFSPSAQDEYLADGMTEELITAISGIQGLRVIARTSVMRFKKTESDISEIGRMLRAGTILEGSFRKVGDRIRVTVQLIETSSEEHLWASNYDGDMQDIFSIQTDIANKVAQALKVKLLDSRPPTQKTVNIEAYELYLKGRNFWNRRTAEGVSQALKLFDKAIEIDSTYSRAYSGKADSYIIGKNMELPDGKFLFDEEKADVLAEEAIRKAIELDSNVAEAHASYGLLLNNAFRFAEAEIEFKKALSLNQSYASAHHWYAICLANMGRLEESIGEAKLASQSDPLAAPARTIIGVEYLYAREYKKALEIFNEVLELDPGYRSALSFRSGAYACMGMEEQAVKDMERSIAMASSYQKNLMMACETGWWGHKELALKYFGEVDRTTPPHKDMAFDKAAFAACLGDADEFFKWATKAIESKHFSPADVRYVWWLDKVRGDSRFAELLAKLPH